MPLRLNGPAGKPAIDRVGVRVRASAKWTRSSKGFYEIDRIATGGTTERYFMQHEQATCSSGTFNRYPKSPTGFLLASDGAVLVRTEGGP
jgi:hypothetical protein